VIPPADEFSLTIDNCQLQLRWCAPRADAASPVIVLLHQGLGSITQWRNFPDILAARCGLAVLAYDRRGHGRSCGLEGPRAPDFLDREAQVVLPALLDALGIERPVLYGHSDGGTIALMFAAAFSGRPAAVISEAAHVFSEVEASGGVAALAAAFHDGDLRAKLARHHGANVDRMFDGWASLWRSPAMSNWNMTDRLPRIVAPLLLIQGEDDEHGSLAQIDAIVAAARGPTETFLIPECGHIPHLERTEMVADRVAAFLAGTTVAG
jgi:pimeloyl-ACP methyl ester carboxylesterase